MALTTAIQLLNTNKNIIECCLKKLHGRIAELHQGIVATAGGAFEVRVAQQFGRVSCCLFLLYCVSHAAVVQKITSKIPCTRPGSPIMRALQ